MHLLCVFTFTMILRGISSYQEAGVEVDGSFSDDFFDDTMQSESIDIDVFSTYDEDVDIKWREDEYSDDYTVIASIEAHGSTGLNTVAGHKFHVFYSEDTHNADPLESFIASSSKQAHTIGPKGASASINKYKVASEIDLDEQEERPDESAVLARFNVRPIGEPLAVYAAIQVRSLYPRELDMWYDDDGDGVWHGHLRTGKETTVNSYQGHAFYFTEKDRPNERVARIVASPSQVLYLIRANTKEDEAKVPASLLAETELQETFMREYEERTGLQWRHYFGNGLPRPSPLLNMWPASYIGRTRTVHTEHGYWNCNGSSAACQALDPVDLTMTVVSLAPRVFVIEKFLSDYECSAIIALARPKVSKSQVGDEEVGAMESSTRTSKNAWVHRSASQVTDTLYKRAADVLGLDERLLVPEVNAEQMQVVHYAIAQRYDAHHDWGISNDANSRLITLLMYLTDMEDEHAGGETAFPKANNGSGFKIHPGKGNAVLFYNLLEDGNGDDLALHAAMPVKRGEKWLANFWVWDPSYK